MRVKELMTAKVITASPNDTITKAAKLMVDYDIGMVVVINEEREVLGILTDRDIVTRLISQDKGINHIVDDAMTHTVVSVNKDNKVEDAIEMMKDHQLRRLVVVNDDMKLVGVVSLADVAINKFTNKMLNDMVRGISQYDEKTYEPLKYLQVDSYRL